MIVSAFTIATANDFLHYKFLVLRTEFCLQKCPYKHNDHKLHCPNLANPRQHILCFSIWLLRKCIRLTHNSILQKWFL